MATIKSRPQERRIVTINFSDSADCCAEDIHWCDRGVTLHTKWFFRQGTEVELGFEVDRKKHSCSGVVVDCESLEEPGSYLMTLFFLEAPCHEIQSAARSLCGQGNHSEPAFADVRRR